MKIKERKHTNYTNYMRECSECRYYYDWDDRTCQHAKKTDNKVCECFETISSALYDEPILYIGEHHD